MSKADPVCVFVCVWVSVADLRIGQQGNGLRGGGEEKETHSKGRQKTDMKINPDGKIYNLFKSKIIMWNSCHAKS